MTPANPNANTLGAGAIALSTPAMVPDDMTGRPRHTSAACWNRAGTSGDQDVGRPVSTARCFSLSLLVHLFTPLVGQGRFNSLHIKYKTQRSVCTSSYPSTLSPRIRGASARTLAYQSMS